MKIQELRHKSKEELMRMLSETRSGIFNLRMDKINAQLKNVKQMQSQKRMIARILTILKEKDINK